MGPQWRARRLPAALRTLQCDCNWDPALAFFPGTRRELHDLRLRGESEALVEAADLSPLHHTPALPCLVMLECTFAAAAAALSRASRRSVSTPDPPGKHAKSPPARHG